MIQFKLHQGKLLKKAIWPLLGIRPDGFFRYSPEGISLIFQRGTFVAVLQLQSSDFQIFECDRNGFGAFNIDELYMILLTVGVEESLTMYADHGDPDVQFLILKHGTYLGGFRPFSLFCVDDDGDVPDQSGAVYDLVVGITPRKFRFILDHLVTPSDRDNLVKFSTTKGEIVLQREDSECIIGGALNEPVGLNFATDYIEQLWKASLFSNIVWILESEKMLILFNFPNVTLGNIMFYFPNNL